MACLPVPRAGVRNKRLAFSLKDFEMFLHPGRVGKRER